MKATTNSDGVLVLFPTTQVELFACKTLVCKLTPPVIIIDAQPYMNEHNYVKKVNAQNPSRDSVGS